MTRPHSPPHLVPRQPRSVLGWTMQKTRIANDWTGKRVAQAFGCSPAHISRVEQGHTRPSRALVHFYEDAFGADGLLLSLLEVVDHSAEQGRRRGESRDLRAVPGDASEFIDDTIPHGTLLRRGEIFTKTWRVRNSGSVRWIGRRLERQGPLTGPGLITSSRFCPVPDAKPGSMISIEHKLKSPGYACSSIAYFKMVDADGMLCFPDSYQLGLDVLVRVS
jgi:transcriptional regulator with XRE-family HTH domain